MIDLAKKQKELYCGIGLGVVALLAFFLYMPLLERIDRAGDELSELQQNIKSSRSQAGSMKPFEGEPIPLPKKYDIPRVIDEITALGNAQNIDFRSIRPGNPGAATQGYSLLPIDMNLEAEYANLTEFVGSLKSLRLGLVTIEQFDIERDKNIFPKIRSSLSVNLVCAVRDE